MRERVSHGCTSHPGSITLRQRSCYQRRPRFRCTTVSHSRALPPSSVMNNRKRLQHSFLLSMLCEPMLVAPCCCLMNEQHLLVLDIPAWGAAAPAAVAPGEAIDRFLSNLVPEAMNVYFSSQHHPAHCTPLKEQWYGAKYSVEPLCQASVALQASAKAADKCQVLVQARAEPCQP